MRKTVCKRLRRAAKDSTDNPYARRARYRALKLYHNSIPRNQRHKLKDQT